MTMTPNSTNKEYCNLPSPSSLSQQRKPFGLITFGGCASALLIFLAGVAIGGGVVSSLSLSIHSPSSVSLSDPSGVSTREEGVVAGGGNEEEVPSSAPHNLIHSPLKGSLPAARKTTKYEDQTETDAQPSATPPNSNKRVSPAACPPCPITARTHIAMGMHASIPSATTTSEGDGSGLKDGADGPLPHMPSQQATIISMYDADPYKNAWEGAGKEEGSSSNNNNISTATSWGAPRIFEAFLFYNEIELLEIRIAELYNVVEKFVVVETLTTFGEGKASNGTFDVLQHELPAHFRQKIAHFKCKLVKTVTPFVREKAARDCAKRAAFLAGLRPFDLLHFGDADEIARATAFASVLQTTREIMRDSGPDNQRSLKDLRDVFPVGVRMQYFSHNFLTITLPDEPQWVTDLFLIFDRDTLMEAVRGATRSSLTRDVGWHCSWCHPRVSLFKEKFLAYSHTETVDERNYSPENVWNATCGEGNIFKFKGPDDRYTRRISQSGGYATPPRYLLANANNPRFQFLIPDEVTCKIPI